MAVHNCTQGFGSKVRIWQKDFSFICAEVHIEASKLSVSLLVPSSRISAPQIN